MKIVITGIGPVTAIGTGVAEFYTALAANESAIGSEGTERVPIEDFDVDDYIDTPKPYLDRTTAFAFAALTLAADDAALELRKRDAERTGLFFGTALGPMETMERFCADLNDKGPRFVKPFLFPHTYTNATLSLLAIEYGLGGYHVNVTAGFTAGASALQAAFDKLSAGEIDVALAGASDALSEPAYRLARTILPSGTPIGEAGLFLVLEQADHARQRGARIYAELDQCYTGPGAIPAPTSATEDNLCILAGANFGRDRLSEAGQPGASAEAAPLPRATIDTTPMLGVMFGAGTLVGTAMAAGCLNGRWSPGKPETPSRAFRHAEIHSHDPGGTCASINLSCRKGCE